MNDLEDLLRDTLTDPRRRVDPAGGMYEAVNRRAHDIRRNRWTLASAATAVIAVVATATTVAANSTAHRAQPGHQTSSTATGSTPTGSSSAPPRGGTASAIDVGKGWPSDAAITSDGLYVLTNNPNQIVKLDAAGSSIKATADLPTTASGVTTGDGRVWVWTQQGGQLYAFDTANLQPVGAYDAGLPVNEVADVDGYLYLTTGNGLLRAPANASASGRLATTAVAGIDGNTYGIAADPTRHRVLVGAMPAGSTSFAGVRVVAIDTRTGKVVAQSAQTSVGKESIAVVGDQVWVGGFGDTDKPLIEHLDATTLKVIGSSPVGDEVGPGAILWPGADVLWVRNGGNEGLSCVDPKTGAILEQWLAVQGPVVSGPGHAYGIQSGLQPLSLTGGCTG